MHDHEDAIAHNKTKEQISKIRTLSKQATLPWVTDAILDWLLIGSALFFACRINSFFAYFLALFIIGNRQHALAILGHDGAHFTIHSDRKWNDFLSNIFCFWPLLITTEGYRRLHFTHHNHTGTSKDPELLHKKARSPQWNLPLNKQKVFFYVVKDIFGYSLPDLFIILTFSKPDDKKQLLPALAMHSIFVSIALASGYWQIPLLWYGALATTFMMFFRLRLWIEHQGTFTTQRVTLNPLQAMVIAPHKAWLHWEHHLFPTVPYSRLENARLILKGPPPLNISQLLSGLEKSTPLPSGATIDDAAAFKLPPAAAA